MINALRWKTNYKEVLGAIMGAIMLCIIWLGVLHIYEYSMPTSRRFEYKEVIPTKNIYKYGDRITLLSTVNRKRSINMQWQDLAYCKYYEDEYWHKLPTQYRPDQGMEYITPWYRSSIREYSIKIPDNMFTCKMCGNSIWTTRRWYKKVFNYCTSEFMVNQ